MENDWLAAHHVVALFGADDQDDDALAGGMLIAVTLRGWRRG